MKLFLAVLLLIPILSYAEDIRVSEVTRVYDGDTFFVEVDGWPPILQGIGIRVEGVDTPEMRGKCKKEKDLAIKAKYHVLSLIRDADVVKLTNIQKGKYFRIVAGVDLDGVDLSTSLIEHGFAVPYDGGTKSKNWCEK